MIKKILEIDNLGIFKNFHWPDGLKEFKKFNLIYGWNGSGKTTLTDLFSALEKGQSTKYPELKYKIETENGNFSQGMEYPKKIRVFNKEYVSDNIDFLECNTKPIVILGKENKQLAKLIKQDENMLAKQIQEMDELKNNLTQKKDYKGKTFTNVARIISSIPSGVATRTYTKTHAEKDFYELDHPELLSKEDQQKCSIIFEQQPSDLIKEITVSSVEEDVGSLISDANSLLKSTVETVMIKRLKENPDISQWVEAGYQLHFQKKSTKCEFCNQPLPEERMRELAAFFNEADSKLKTEINDLLHKIDELYSKIKTTEVPDKVYFYSESQSQYQVSVERFKNAKQSLLSKIKNVNQEVDNKKLHTTERLALEASIDAGAFLSTLNEVNNHIKDHNEKTRNFAEEKETAEEKLKKNELSDIWDEVKSIDSDISRIRQKINTLENGDPDDPRFIGINKLHHKIEDNKKKISQSRLACTELNQKVADFLGRSELVFELEEEGYIIKHHHGKKAENLSEGEKTAIAFVYFTISLQEESFDLEDGIIVIDDPISSLDSNSLFQAFAFLKHAVQNAHQVFILTHNYDFLRMLINWRTGVRKNNGDTACFMIMNSSVYTNRKASLEKLDDLLLNYPSEYQYLFKILHTFSPKGTIVSVYHLPNIARKVLEHFLMIMVPNSRSIYMKLKLIKFDPIKKAAIYKFTNQQSHMTGKDFDPSLVSEAEHNIKHLLEMIKACLPDHYERLVNAINNPQQ